MAPLGAADRAPGPVVWSVLILCIGIEGILIGADLGLWGHPFWRRVVLGYGAFWPGYLTSDVPPLYPGQGALMWVSYGFLHGGWLHLGVNMMALWSLAPAVAARLGHLGLIYGISLLGGAAGYALLSQGLTPMVGASGALFGLAGAVVAVQLRDRPARGLRSLAILVLLNAVLWALLGGQLAWQTHLGGFLAGAAVGGWLARQT